MEVWACDNPSPNVSFLCKQILPIGPIQNSMKSHRRTISQSKPLCEREDWKDMKALACILTRLSPSFSPSPFCPLPRLYSHSNVWPSSFNLRYFVTVSSVVRGSSAPAQKALQNPMNTHVYALFKDPQAAVPSEQAVLLLAARVSETKLHCMKQNITACGLTGLIFGICLLIYFHNSSGMIGNWIWGEKNLFDFASTHFNLICIHQLMTLSDNKIQKNRCWL